jgi:hypothetical protein
VGLNDCIFAYGAAARDRFTNAEVSGFTLAWAGWTTAAHRHLPRSGHVWRGADRECDLRVMCPADFAQQPFASMRDYVVTLRGGELSLVVMMTAGTAWRAAGSRGDPAGGLRTVTLGCAGDGVCDQACENE